MIDQADSVDPTRAPILLASGALRIGRRLGSGATSQVWLAEWNDQLCAVKVGSAESAALLASEALRLTLVRSAYLPRALDAGRLPTAGHDEALPAGAPYLLLSFSPGVPLAELWAEADPRALARAVARDIGQALADLHSVHIAHGDVKPSNIIVERAGGGFTCRLIDLGMADDASRGIPEGATPRYLAPEVTTGGPGDARGRDLWALGLTLLEIVSREARASDSPRLSLTYCAEARDLPWLAGLLSEEPGARPRAAWIARQAGSLPSNSAARIERSYLAVRFAELSQVPNTGTYNVLLPGTAGQWLRSACAVLSRIGSLRAHVEPGPAVSFESLPARRQRDWLLRLIGARIVDFPELPPQTDDALADALCAAAALAPIESLNFAEVARRVRPVSRSVPTERHELALLLGAEAPDEGVLDAAESWSLQNEVPQVIRLATARALKRRGEFARALTLLASDASFEAGVERAAAHARLGHLDKAAQLLEECLPAAPTQAALAEATALFARVRLHQGNAAAASMLIHGQPDCLTVLETRASIALSNGDLQAAGACLQDAVGLAADAEQRARLEALNANLAQQTGDSRAAFESFRRAAEHAARAGALVEEATYCIGVAGTALELGKGAQALAAATRATQLFDHLDRPGAAARAALSYASGLLALGAYAEATSAAESGLLRARAANDVRCEGFCRLVLADLAPGNHDAHLTAAAQLLAPLRADDRLRIGARQAAALTPGLERDELDELAQTHVPSEVKFEWWAARAAERLAHDDGTHVELILSPLSQLRAIDTPVEARGRAFALGAQLAAAAGDGERTRAFTEAAAKAYEQLYQGAPEELQSAVRQLPWVRGLSMGEPSPQLRSEQMRDLEHVLGALAERDHLRALLTRVVDALVLWTGVERGLLLLKTPGGGLAPRAARNLARHDLVGEQRQLSMTLAERALHSGECVVAIDASGELSTFHTSVHSLKLRSVLAVPLQARGEVLGVVYLDDRIRRGAFGRSELAWVRLLASLAALAISDTRDQLLLKRSVRRASLAEKRLSALLVKTRTELQLRTRELERERPVRNREKYASLVGESPEMFALLGLIDRVAGSDVPVLVRGESGSGKELVARALHENSPRARQAFVAENCSAIPESLLESTLFGHVRGAFTGAVQKHAGLFEMADGGTLFLDEIADMSLAMQAKLLRVLESGELRRIGSERATKINVRVIGASHRSLEVLAASGAFREDLLYRLNVVTLEVPALRQRSGDIPVLIQHFLTKHGGPTAPRLDEATLNILTHYAWPGNIRQLENEVRRAVLLCDGVIRPAHLSPALQNRDPSPADTGLNLKARLDSLETELISQALKQAKGNQTKAAQTLGISRFGLQKMLKRLGLSAHAGQGNQVAVTDS